MAWIHDTSAQGCSCHEWCKMLFFRAQALKQPSSVLIGLLLLLRPTKRVLPTADIHDILLPAE